MQVYTKILLGMVVGAVIGLTLGPTSALLTADTYKVSDASVVEMRIDRFDDASVVALPKGLALRMNVLETVTEPMVDAVGTTHEVPVWVRVRFRFTNNMGLRDPEGQLRERLGNPKTDDWVEVWLHIKHTRLASGGVTAWPRPISGFGDTLIEWLKPVGALFMRLITMVIVPLVFSSLLVGVASLGDVRKLGRLGIKTLALYLCTTAIAVTIGLVCAQLIKPGSFVDEGSRIALQAQFLVAAGDRVEQAATAPSAVDNILNIVPTNPIASLSGGNMLQIIFFALIFGIALTLLDTKSGQPVVKLFDRVQQAMVVIIHMVMAVAPYGVAALVAEVIGTSGWSVLKALLVYTLVVFLGLTIHATFIYGGLVKWFAKLRIGDFLRAARPAQLIAFSTSSSSAALPVTMECAEESLGVSKSVSSFILPLGSTVNMDGTALYQGVAAVFIAQVFQLDLTIGAQIGIVLTATMASVGAAGVPGAGMITLAMVLTTAGIPPVGVALILGMDRLIDMFRTAVNVTGDLAVAAVMAVSEGEKLKPLTPDADAADPDRGFEGRLDKKEEHPVDPDHDSRGT
ncbi:MAG: dicarboxylate/amino acid:cation symporter [Myxococcota bacterium]